jgi:G patch domain-containing protein 1
LLLLLSVSVVKTMGSDEEDFVFHGTPIEREEEIASRKKKAVAGASGNLRTLPAWKQEVTDEEGRRRFHGAFTGGYSAGYYNTVGSKEGWAPQSFTSSRQNRAGARKQSISDFLDEDEKADMEGKSLSASSQFDTFGFTAAEHSRKHAEKEQHERPSAIPGPVPDELVAPVSESIGVKLLLKMGWRRGHSIKEVRASSDARREARKAFLAFYTDENTKETPDSLVSETEVETSLGEDIKISESTPVSQFSCFSFQTSYMLLIVIATGVILLLVILFLNFSSTFY